MHKVILSSLTVLFSLVFPSLSSSQSVICGNGTAISVFSPLNRTNDYCVYEVIYFASQIGITGNISAIGFERWDGSNTDSIENVSLFLKHTPAFQLAAGNYDTSGYTLVYTGSFPNDAGTGWREVNLTGLFNYNNVDNLQMLILKDYQPAIANTPVTPRWLYTNTSTPTRARRYYGPVPITNLTALTTTSFTSNSRLTFGTTGVAEIKPESISVFPNPSTGIVNFQFLNEYENMQLHIINTLGQTVYQQEISGDFYLDFKLPGLFMYSVYSSDGMKKLAQGKFIITN